MTFNKNLLTATLLTVAGLTAVSSANATETTGTFNVESTVTATCTLNMPSAAINFDMVAGETPERKTSAIGAVCSKGAPYTIKLDSLNDTLSTTGQGKMVSSTFTETNGNKDVLTYDIYQGLTGNAAWGQTFATTGTTPTEGNVVSGTGAGLAASGAIANSHDLSIAITNASTDIKNDTYSDTITATIAY